MTQISLCWFVVATTEATHVNATRNRRLKFRNDALAEILLHVSPTVRRMIITDACNVVTGKIKNCIMKTTRYVGCAIRKAPNSKQRSTNAWYAISTNAGINSHMQAYDYEVSRGSVTCHILKRNMIDVS